MTIADMCKRHTELNVLVCCLSRVKKEQSTMVWKTTGGFRVPHAAFTHRCWKIFGVEKFLCV